MRLPQFCPGLNFDHNISTVLPVPEFDENSPFDYRSLDCEILERTEDGCTEL